MRDALTRGVSDLRWLNAVAHAHGTPDAMRFLGGNQESMAEQEARVQGCRQDEIARQLQEEVGALVTYTQAALARGSGVGGAAPGGAAPDGGEPGECAVM